MLSIIKYYKYTFICKCMCKLHRYFVGGVIAVFGDETHETALCHGLNDLRADDERTEDDSGPRPPTHQTSNNCERVIYTYTLISAIIDFDFVNYFTHSSTRLQVNQRRLSGCFQESRRGNVVSQPVGTAQAVPAHAHPRYRMGHDAPVDGSAVWVQVRIPRRGT